MYLDETTVAAIDELAERESRSRSGMLGVIVKNWLWLDQQEPADSGQREPEVVSAGPLAGKSRPRKRDDAMTVQRGGVREGIPTDEGWVAPQVSSEDMIQQEAIKPTLDQRRAERSRKRGGAPAAPVDTPASGPPAGSTNAPGKPHRHRYVTEVPGSRQGRAGVIQADFACACGEVKRQAVR